MNKKAKNILKAIFLGIFLFSFIIPFQGQAAWVGDQNNATLALSPDSGLYRAATGVTFDIDIIINTHGQQVNSATAIIDLATVDQSRFSITILNCNDAVKPSIFYIGGLCQEAEKSVNATTKQIRITRGVAFTSSPNYINTTSGRFATLRITGLADTAPASDNFTFEFTAGRDDLSNVFLLSPLGGLAMSGADNGKFSLDGTPPPNVTSFTASPSKNQISLTWNNPGGIDWQGVKIIRKTGSYPTSITDGTQVYDSNGTSYIDPGLTNGTSYYYSAFSRDTVLNYSTPGSGSQAYATPYDNVIPAQINNLAASNLTNATALKTVVLTWAAVGDDGNTGTAASYDIRYSTAVIIAGNWASATQVTGEPTPMAAGQSETFNVVFPVPTTSGNTTYYWAIKATDAAGNPSPLSNIPFVTTLRASDINNSGTVNGTDFSILLGWWLDSTRSPADLNQSGQVNGQDFSIMMGEWTG